MRILRRKAIILGILSAIGIGACSWLTYRQSYPLFHASLIITLLILICFYQQLQKLKTAQLIVENAILTTDSSVIAGENKDQASQLLPDKEPVKVILSCFGVLSGDDVYKFNRDGIRLFSVEINPEDMLFVFGTNKGKKYLRFDHCISSLEQIRIIAEKLRYETGVSPIVTGWDME